MSYTATGKAPFKGPSAKGLPDGKTLVSEDGKWVAGDAAPPAPTVNEYSVQILTDVDRLPPDGLARTCMNGFGAYLDENGEYVNTMPAGTAPWQVYDWDGTVASNIVNLLSGDLVQIGTLGVQLQIQDNPALLGLQYQEATGPVADAADWAASTSYFSGALASYNGILYRAAINVPMALAIDVSNETYWKSVSTSVFVGTDGISDGVAGSVPAPLADDAGKGLSANGGYVAFELMANKSVDISLDSASDILYPTNHAVAVYVANLVTGIVKLKGDIDASTNPDYPAGLVGDTYQVSVAGRVGGASGILVDVGDSITCKADNAGGTQAAVGTSWYSLEHNLAGVILSSVGTNILLQDGTNLSDAAVRTKLGLGPFAILAAGTSATFVRSDGVHATAPVAGEDVVSTTTYTMVAGDHMKTKYFTNSSGCVITGPAPGVICKIQGFQYGAIPVSLTSSTAVRTRRNAAGLYGSAGLYSEFTITAPGHVADLIITGEVA